MQMQVYLPNKNPSTDLYLQLVFFFELYIGGFMYNVMGIVIILDRLVEFCSPC